MTEGKTFVRITNQMIFDEVKCIKEHILKINGKVVLNRWIATTALAIVLLMVGAFVSIR